MEASCYVYLKDMIQKDEIISWIQSIHGVCMRNPYFLLFPFSVVPFFIYGKNVINSQYNSFQYVKFEELFSTWLPGNGGFFSGILVPPLDFIFWCLSRISPEWFVVEFSLSLILFIAFLSSYRLIFHIFRDPTIAFICSLVHGYSIFGQFMSTDPISAGSIIFALAPFFIWRFLHFSEGDGVWREVALLSLVSFAFDGVNLTFLVYLWSFCFVIVLFRWWQDSWWTFVRVGSVFVLWSVVFLGVNAAFFSAYLSEYFTQKTYVETSLAAETIDWKSSTNALSELWREMGSVNFYYKFINYSYPNAQVFIKNSFFIILSYIIPISAIGAFLWKPNLYWRRFRIVLGALLALSLFMSMGVYEFSPTRLLYRYISEHIPFFAIFRDAYKPMFIINLLYVIFIGYSLFRLRAIHILSFRLAGLGILLVIGILSFQFWGGSFLQHELIAVPGYWYDLRKYYQEQETEKRVLFLPEMPFSVYGFTSQRGKFTTFYRPLLSWNNISNIDISPGPKMNQVFHLAYDHYRDPTFARILGMYGVGYALVQRDADWEVYKSIHPDLIEEQMSDDGISLVRKFE